MIKLGLSSGELAVVTLLYSTINIAVRHND